MKTDHSAIWRICFLLGMWELAIYKWLAVRISRIFFSSLDVRISARSWQFCFPFGLWLPLTELSCFLVLSCCPVLGFVTLFGRLSCIFLVFHLFYLINWIWKKNKKTKQTSARAQVLSEIKRNLRLLQRGFCFRLLISHPIKKRHPLLLSWLTGKFQH